MPAPGNTRGGGRFVHCFLLLRKVRQLAPAPKMSTRSLWNDVGAVLEKSDTSSTEVKCLGIARRAKTSVMCVAAVEAYEGSVRGSTLGAALDLHPAARHACPANPGHHRRIH